MLGLKDVYRGVVVEEQVDHGEVAVEGGVVQGGLAVLEHGIGGPASLHQELEGAGVVADGRADEVAGGLGRELLEDGGVGREDALETRLVVNFRCVDEAEPDGAALHEEIKHGGVAELMGRGCAASG